LFIPQKKFKFPLAKTEEFDIKIKKIIEHNITFLITFFPLLIYKTSSLFLTSQYLTPSMGYNRTPLKKSTLITIDLD